MTECRVIVGDCRIVMGEMEPNSVDAICTDPPYLLNFMNKEFDSQGGAHANPAMMQAWHESWAVEVIRVLRPGGHLLAFGGDRTVHRLTCALEDAGFEVRGQIAWIHSQGFPKGLDFAKDAEASRRESRRVPLPQFVGTRFEDGWNVALKPAMELVVMARKPLSEKGVAANVLAHGTGALNIAASRISSPLGPTDGRRTKGNGLAGAHVYLGEWTGDHEGPSEPHPDSARHHAAGRWPANVVLGHADGCIPRGTRRVRAAGWRNTDNARSNPGRSGETMGDGWSGTTSGHYADADGTEDVEAWECAEGCPIAILDAQSGERKGSVSNGSKTTLGMGGTDTFRIHPREQRPSYGDTGGASRYFLNIPPDLPIDDPDLVPFRYVAKSSRRERNMGLEAMPGRTKQGARPESPNPTGKFPDHDHRPSGGNHHPCVKPIALMRWLVRLVTQPGGTILDPFLGSGSTGCAAVLEGFAFVGVEQDPGYALIAERRIAHALATAGQGQPAPRRPRSAPRASDAPAAASQGALWSDDERPDAE